MNIFSFIPLFAVILIIYNVMAFFFNVNFGVSAPPMFDVPLMSGAVWSPTSGDLLLMLGVIFLYIEVFKATNAGAASIVDHALSTFVFIVFLIEFIVVKNAGTSTFIILALMSLLDVIAGFTITISSARRDFSVN
jgi:hypothetical protein